MNRNNKAEQQSSNTIAVFPHIEEIEAKFSNTFGGLFSSPLMCDLIFCDHVPCLRIISHGGVFRVELTKEQLDGIMGDTLLSNASNKDAFFKAYKNYLVAKTDYV